VDLAELQRACSYYEARTSYDQSLRAYRQRIGGSLDARNAEHVVALIAWLNSWQCRIKKDREHLRRFTESLQDWAGRWEHELPNHAETLLDLSVGAIGRASDAYADLAARDLSGRRLSSTASAAETTASKILFALRPAVFPPWDSSIRGSFRARLLREGQRLAGRRAYVYACFLMDVQERVRDLCAAAASEGVPTEGIPARVGRPESSLVKLIDEYNWVTTTRGIAVKS